MIYNFQYYKLYEALHSLFESELVMSVELYDILKQLPYDNIAVFLMNAINKNNQSQYTFNSDKNLKIDSIDISKSPGFMEINKNRPDGKVIKQKIKIGRLFQSIIGNDFKPEEIEQFVKNIHAIQKGEDPSIKLVDGDDIIKYYNESSYSIKGGGPLSKSCMRYAKCEEKIRFYAENCKDVVKLLIKLDKDGKVTARALLWKIDTGLYLDRVYYNDAKDETLFINYAKKNLGVSKVYGDDEEGLNIAITKVKIPFNSKRDIFPYMDTFVYAVEDNNTVKLYSDEMAAYSKNTYVYHLDNLNQRMIAIDTFGYDEYGYDDEGFNRDGFDRNGYDSEGYDAEGYDEEGWDSEGFNREGYDSNGYDRQGYNEEGWDEDGFDEEGYDEDGFDKDGYNKEGYNKNGFDRDGYNKEGYDEDGFDREGFNKEGYDTRGLTKDSYDEEGYDEEGYNNQGYDREGFNKKGYSMFGSKKR